MKNGSCNYCGKLNPKKRINNGITYYCSHKCREDYLKNRERIKLNKNAK